MQNQFSQDRTFTINPFIPNEYFHPYQLDESISIFGMFFPFLFEFLKTLLYANSGEPDQTPRFAASDMVLHCLLMSHKKDARLMWVNYAKIFSGLLKFISSMQLLTKRLSYDKAYHLVNKNLGPKHSKSRKE